MSEVIADPQAIAGTHPLARNRASQITPSSTRAEISSTSPQAGFSVRTLAVASANSPANRGCSKCSNSRAEYMPAFYKFPKPLLHHRGTEFTEDNQNSNTSVSLCL